MTRFPAPPRASKFALYSGFVSPVFMAGVLLTHGSTRWAILGVQLALLAVQLVAFARFQRAYRGWKRQLKLGGAS